MRLTNADLRRLTDTPNVPELGPGVRKGVASQEDLSRELESLFDKLSSPHSDQELLRATVYLWHDHHEAAHSIAQRCENADGSYIHGIIHRREPDYSNARYWFRRVGQHPCFAPLAKGAQSVLANAAPELRESLTPSGKWDALAFVEACEKFSGMGNKEEDLLRQIQAMELELLLQHLAGAH